jgi:hypothetical protein
MISILVFDEFVGMMALAEQECFTAKVAKYDRLRSQQREAEKQVEMLFQSLLSQSFGG